MKKILRQTAYHSSFLHRHHKKRNKNTLTVVSFHRVLPKDNPEWEGADPEWTVTTEFFEECLLFFRKHYSVVGFPEVLENYRGGPSLPDNPLLITFDDGWKCNLQHAAPLLEKLGFPAILFVATGATGKPILSWQEALFALWKSNKLCAQKTNAIAKLAGIAPPGPVVSEAEYHEFLAKLRDRPLDTRNKLNAPLFDWISTLPGLPYMLNRKELLEWQKRGFHLGTHGINHEPMVDMENSHQELHISKHTLSQIAGNEQAISCFSPPHGIYNEDLLETAAKIGYLCACTSRKGLNHTRERSGFIDLGRININQLALMNPRRKLDPSKLASLLFLQPILEQ